MTKFLFVCRGSVKDGLGHLMRCKTIISAFPRLDNILLLVVGDSIASALLEESNIKYAVVGSEQGIVSIATDFNPDVVVFDLLYLNQVVFDELRLNRLTASISPIFNFQKEVDVSYSRTKYDQKPEFITDPKHKHGLQYTPIGEHCTRIPEETYRATLQKSPLSVAICMGGSDALNSTFVLLQQMRHIPVPLLFWVLVGEGYAHSYQDLINCVKEDAIHEIVVAKTARSMWRILNDCSIAIFAGGLTTYEAVYAGLPSINVIFSKDHQFLLRELEEAGVCFCVGSDTQLFGKRIEEILVGVNSNREQLLNMHRRAKVLIDGSGAYRIAKELQELAGDKDVPSSESQVMFDVQHVV